MVERKLISAEKVNCRGFEVTHGHVSEDGFTVIVKSYSDGESVPLGCDWAQDLRQECMATQNLGCALNFYCSGGKNFNIQGQCKWYAKPEGSN
ncbi:hypothetical protein HNV12_03000 [Methanococcoides sp. SA1]|nr:hypothetical protein [Methanococcoides sp. SA1]